MIFVDVMVPVLIIISIGYTTGKLVPDFHLKSLSKISIYILSPALVFTSLVETSLTAKDAGQLGLVIYALAFTILAINIILARVFKLSRSKASAFNLSTLFMNVGNYGIPIAFYAFGQAGLEREVIILVFQAILVHTLGVFLASSSHLDWKKAALKVIQIPPIYAVLLALFFNTSGLSLPAPVFQAVDTIGKGSVPIFLILLGLQLARTNIKGNLKFILSASSIRLLLSPALAFLLIKVFQITGLNAQILLMASATPTGVVATLYSIEMDASPELVSGSTLLTTVLSFVTMSLMLNLLI